MRMTNMGIWEFRNLGIEKYVIDLCNLCNL
jgi:hypothetical protein